MRYQGESVWMREADIIVTNLVCSTSDFGSMLSRSDQFSQQDYSIIHTERSRVESNI